MYRPLFMSGLLVLIAIAGCFGGGDDEPSPSPSRSPDPRPGDFRVTIRNYTAQGLVGEPVNVTWEVAPSVDSQNATNSSFFIRHTAVHWGNQSVADPSAAPKPGGTVPTTTTASLTSTTPTDAVPTTHPTSPTTGTTPTSPRDYPNETDEQSGPPGTFNESFPVYAKGLVYLRVHAQIGNQSFWSDEVIVNVTSNASLPLGQQHIVEIGKTQPGPLADYSPRALTNVKVGDSVVWKNVDALSLQHTATSTAGTPAFDTKGIAKNEISKPVFFNATGSWTYRCDFHRDTMNGATIVVT